jgi:hypothetical protein
VGSRLRGIGGGGARRRGLVVLFAVAAALIPAAIAWACNPQAHLSLNSSSYGPGDSISVSGSYFNSADTIVISGPVDSTQVSGVGSFNVALKAPSSPGTYTITATVSGGERAGLSRSASFEVAAPSSPSAPSNASSQSFNQPKAPHVAGVGGGGGTAHTESGQAVFAGSVAPSSGGGGGTFFSGAAADQGATAAPSERSAVSDVWSAFAPGKTASLTSAAAMPDGGTESQQSIGIILLAVGLLALIGGLTAAEVSRRRRAV